MKLLTIIARIVKQTLVAANALCTAVARDQRLIEHYPVTEAELLRVLKRQQSEMQAEILLLTREAKE